jgi:hypothetical protein
MPVGRRMTRNGISDADRAEIRRELLAEIREAFSTAETLDDVAEALEISDGEPLSYGDVAAMTEAQINSDWERVSSVLEAGPGADPMALERAADEQRQQEQQRRPPTGGQIGGGGTSGDVPTPITRDSLRTMSVEEHIARKAEVDAFLSGGGSAA